MKVSKEVVDLAESLVNSEPSWKKYERPNIKEVKEINVIDDGEPYVEVCFERELFREENHASGTQKLFIAFFPHKHEYEWSFVPNKNPALLDTYGDDKISDEMQQVYELFTAVIGRITYHGKS